MDATWIATNLDPVITATGAIANLLFSYTIFQALLLGVCGLSLIVLVLGLIKR